MAEAPKRKSAHSLYLQVLAAIVLGALLGVYFPDIAQSPWMEAMGKGFVNLIKMVIAPIIFCTIVSGIAHLESAAKVGRVGIKALVYFEVVSTVALALGLLVGNVLRPGEGFSGKADPAAVAKYLEPAAQRTPVEFVLGVIPDSVIGAFAKGDILQVLLFSILFGFALMALGERGRALRGFIDEAGHAMIAPSAVSPVLRATGGRAPGGSRALSRIRWRRRAAAASRRASSSAPSFVRRRASISGRLALLHKSPDRQTAAVRRDFRCSVRPR